MKVKGSLYWIYSFISGCKGKMLVAILLAVIGVLCGMAPYFALAGILSGLIQNTLTAERIFCYVGIAVLGETLKMLFNTVSSLKAHRVAYHRIVFVATHDRELMGLLCTRRMEISNESISVYDLTTK